MNDIVLASGARKPAVVEGGDPLSRLLAGFRYFEGFGTRHLCHAMRLTIPRTPPI